MSKNDDPLTRDLDITADIIERLKDSEFAAEWLKVQDEQTNDLIRKLEEARAKLRQIADIADLTLTRGDYQYGLGQIQGIAKDE